MAEKGLHHPNRPKKRAPNDDTSDIEEVNVPAPATKRKKTTAPVIDIDLATTQSTLPAQPAATAAAPPVSSQLSRRDRDPEPVDDEGFLIDLSTIDDDITPSAKKKDPTADIKHFTEEAPLQTGKKSGKSQKRCICVACK